MLEWQSFIGIRVRFQLYCTLPGQSVRLQHAPLSSVLGVHFHFHSHAPAPVAQGFQPQGASEAGLSFSWRVAAGLELLSIALEQPDDSFQEVDVFLSPFFYYLLQAGGS